MDEVTPVKELLSALILLTRSKVVAKCGVERSPSEAFPGEEVAHPKDSKPEGAGHPWTGSARYGVVGGAEGGK